MKKKGKKSKFYQSKSTRGGESTNHLINILAKKDFNLAYKHLEGKFIAKKHEYIKTAIQHTTDHVDYEEEQSQVWQLINERVWRGEEKRREGKGGFGVE